MWIYTNWDVLIFSDPTYSYTHTLLFVCIISLLARRLDYGRHTVDIDDDDDNGVFSSGYYGNGASSYLYDDGDDDEQYENEEADIEEVKDDDSPFKTDLLTAAINKAEAENGKR